MSLNMILYTRHAVISRTLQRIVKYSCFEKSSVKVFCTSNGLKKSENVIPCNLAAEFNSASMQPGNGFIYDKKPFKMHCEKGKTYFWCLCGRSRKQPLCDGTHKNQHMRITLKPVKFVVGESKEYWICNCKQTSHRPFCDGTHKREDIQTAVK